jgi:uncharacterized protein YbjT (DUF2867 family)
LLSSLLSASEQVVDHVGRDGPHPGRHAGGGQQPPGGRSAAPVASDDHGTTLPYRLLVAPIMRALLGGLYADMAVMEETIRRSGMDWTILRPPQLTDGPRTRTYRQAKDANLRRGYRISRADLADAILASLDDPDTVKATIAVAQ